MFFALPLTGDFFHWQTGRLRCLNFPDAGIFRL
jgi:hypothetical protein